MWNLKAAKEHTAMEMEKTDTMATCNKQAVSASYSFDRVFV